MLLPVSTAQKPPARPKHPPHLTAHPADILTIEQNMIGDHQVEASVRKGNMLTVEHLVGKPSVLRTDRTAGVS